ncbi:HTH-type transcriptional repressor of iron proteins A [Mariniflexile rhizosphaerae]|uniref:AraC family transcriptional regulator n=1 Tax=unclassified Mariniflexile TaxID=2643887 RepID=UPI000CAE7940|nr:AraC family transcriptional regulator [Mariniflexile sp. TRM1-10]AXP82192.1 HTH-type transcriptional repressor of iron proteins A [Mariniflexile sp. TRM1-10]PLB19243.1 MAG: Transcriptional regulator, AraC family [Flavobacteriaceae bacterium FS1-H7996/R]
MKVLPFKIPKPENEALVYQEEHLSVLYDQFHQHSEIQISYVEQGAGTLLVGDTISDFMPNDILVLGGYVPHVFRSDINFSEITDVYTLFFDKNSFGKDFFGLADFESFHDFFNQSDYGIRVLSRKKKLIKQFHKLKYQNKVQRIATLIKIIDHIIKAEKIALSSFVYKKKYTDDEGKRMNDVFNYAMENYSEPITLEEISEIANMSKNAFCRYFKKRTNKTFFQFLIEIRIENACKLIHNYPDYSISYISEQCGFQNTANFNRKFKEIKGVTPSHYRLERF